MRDYRDPAGDAAALDAARACGDPDADAVVSELGSSVWAINALLKGLTRAGDRFPDAVPGAVRALVVPPLPPWADRHRMLRAQRFAQERIVPITTALFCASLPVSYAAADGVKVLLASGRMHDDVDRRVNETARFLLDVLRPHSFEAGGPGLVLCGKVRFIHAAVRAALRPRWDGPLPINQEDMVGTLMTFSVVVLRSLVRLGVPVTERQREDYQHLWCVIGSLLGTPDALLPHGYDAADRLSRLIHRRLFRPSEEGRALMAVLADGYERHLVLPGGRTAAIALVRHLLGDDLAELLGLPLVPPVGRTFERLRRAVPSRLRLPPELGHRLLGSIADAKLAGTRVSFPMPTRLGK